MPLLAQLGNRISLLLHNIVFSFPSPNSTDSNGNVTSASPATPATTTKSTLPSGWDGLEDMLSEPGESRALAGGVGPLSFAGSGYGVTLVIVAILLNRIHHIVRRPRVPAQPLPHPRVDSIYHRAKAAFSRALVSPSTPRYVRLPGLVALVRAWLCFSVLTLQVANLWPVDSPFLLSTAFGRVVNRFGQWAGGMQMDKVCWQVFLSVCLGLICSGFANGLDRGRQMQNGAGFNLVGIVIQEILLSRSFSKIVPTLNLCAIHGRPDLHALFQLWLSLTELTWLQTLEVPRHGRRNQLLPTTVCGSMGLVHFVYALSTSPLKFPSFTFVTHLMALFLSTVIVISMFVKAATHMFTLGYLPSPIFANLLPHDSAIPSLQDDFGVALLKLGTACIEATQYSGLKNELVPIEEPTNTWLELSNTGSEIQKRRNSSGRGGFATEIRDIKVQNADEPEKENTYWREWRGFWSTLFVAIYSLVKWAVMVTPVGRKGVELVQLGWESRWWYGPRQWRFWRREAWQTPIRFQHLAILRRLRKIERSRDAQRKKKAIEKGETSSSATSTALAVREVTPANDDWRAVLRGEVQVDDDEDDWQDDNSSSGSSSGSLSETEDDNFLYRDLVTRPDDPFATDESQALQPVLLAHLTNNSTPLTRRRYAAILSTPTGSATPSAFADVVNDRRMVTQGKVNDDWDDDRKRCCVVCTVESRDTILWPCRCLALCNECRENLAARLPAKDHMCPCCRQKVEGFSRIYIP